MLTFPRKRGRPTLSRPKHDCGTPELAAKRAIGITQEPLDILLQLGFITPTQHQAGLRLRFLHAVVYGLPRPKAYQPEESARSRGEDSPIWLAKCNRDLRNNLSQLLACGDASYKLVTGICIYLEWPSFLQKLMIFRAKGEPLPSLNRPLEPFISGLNALV